MSGRVAAALQPILGGLVEAVVNTMNFYREHSDGNREIATIFLSGGACKIKGMAEYLSRQLAASPLIKFRHVTIRSGDPWINVIERPMKKIPPISKLDSMSYATAIGLALRGAQME
jgi:Tfp pilus assembly PilM family ATPase